MKLLLDPEMLVGFVLAWVVVWFVHSVINGKPFNSFLVFATFVGLLVMWVTWYIKY